MVMMKVVIVGMVVVVVREVQFVRTGISLRVSYIKQVEPNMHQGQLYSFTYT